MKAIVILIPTLNPSEKLINVVKDLKALDLQDIVIVNDGSDSACKGIFDELLKMGCTIYHHRENRGKGAALKTGIKHIMKERKDIFGIVTADDDGQHSPEDIKKIVLKLQEENEVILGVRNIKNKNVPLTSKLGNTFSTLYFKITTGQNLKDTQTGLRGIPSRYFKFALDIPGDRYEYEMQFLEDMYECGMDYKTVNIDTIYEGDRTTHFRFIQDSYLIYKKFFRNIISSLSSAIIDVILFMILVKLIDLPDTIVVSTIIARVVSGIYNFTLNKVWTFEKKESQNILVESQRYLILFILQMLVSGLATSLLNAIFNSSVGLLLIKMFVDFTLFITNFIVQKLWVFNKRKELE